MDPLMSTVKRTVIFFLVLATFHVARSQATAYTPHMTFDVASIREYRETGGMRYIDNPSDNGHYEAVGTSLRGLLMAAYGVDLPPRLENLPNWADTMFVIRAKSDSATDEALAKLSHSDDVAEKRHMLQILLADRFHLKIHAETRTSKTYELISTPRAAKLMTPYNGDIGKTQSTWNPHVSRKGEEFQVTGYPIDLLLGHIRESLGTEVLDHTGLLGRFSFHLMFTAGQLSNSQGAEIPWDEDHYPLLVDAVREQLGLELKETKGPVTFWVIDHVERPTPN